MSSQSFGNFCGSACLRLALACEITVANSPLQARDRATAAEVDKLIQQLGSEVFAVREAGMLRLETIGRPALASLRAARQSTDLEVQRCAQQVLDRLFAPLYQMNGPHFAITIANKNPSSSIRYLRVHRDSLKPAMVRAISCCDQLKSLDILTGHIHHSDIDLSFVEELDSLEELSLQGVGFSDTSLVSMKNLKRLRNLRMYGSQRVTGVALTHLPCPEQLTHLTIHCTGLNDEGFKHISRFKQLTSLSLLEPKVTNHSIAILKELPCIWSISIADAPYLTDACLSQLYQLKLLSSIYLLCPNISEEAVKQLRDDIRKRQR